jgi:hypothetical protein
MVMERVKRRKMVGCIAVSIAKETAKPVSQGETGFLERITGACSSKDEVGALSAPWLKSHE